MILLLGCLNFFDLDGPHGVHVLAHHIGATLAHGLQNVDLHLFAGAFEGDRKQFAIDLRQDSLIALASSSSKSSKTNMRCRMLSDSGDSRYPCH